MMESLGSAFMMAPVQVIIIIIFGGMALAAIIGWRFRQRHEKTKTAGSSDKEDAHEGFLVSTVMGLLALLVGFTFSLAIDRFDARRHNVIDEANAIGTTYLRAQLLEEPHRRRISDLLVRYTDTRIALATAKPGPRVAPLLTRNDFLIADLWTATVAAFPSMRPYDFSSSFLETMNALIDMDTSRKAARAAHVPTEVFLVLIFYLFVAAGVISYVLVGRRGRQTAGFLLFLFGIVLLLVVDVERPSRGGITESQAPMLQLRSFMRDRPPASFDRFNPPAAAILPKHKPV